MRFRIIIEKDEDGMFVAECPSLLGKTIYAMIKK